MAKIMPLFTPL